MSRVLVIHNGSQCPDALAEAAEAYRDAGLQFHSAKFGPEPTVPDGGGVELVFTDSDEIARFYEDRGATVRRPLSQSSDDDDPEPYTVKHKGAGWYKVIGPDGDPMTEKSMRKDDAQAFADDLNANA